MNSSKARNGFTLIELLVVLTVIGLLAALLFPVFLTAREKARQSTCESNLHQIDLTIQMYKSDNDNAFPPSLWALSNYKTEHAIYICPDEDQSRASSYLYRLLSFMSADPAQPQETPGKMLLPDPSTVLAICDNHVTDKFAPALGLGNYIVLRADGSVSRIASKQVVQWSYNAGRWYAPNTPFPLDSSIWNVFPGESWPPKFEK